MTDARYRFSASKAFAAVHWMVCHRQPIDLHAALKACYFADRGHLNEHLQPIFGANYMAMKYGPVPVEIYEIMKGEGLWLWEVQKPETPWILDGYKLKLNGPNDVPSMDEFSESEMAHLESGLQKSCSMTFTARTAATHGRDWQAANGGRMRYEDMIDDRADRGEIIKSIQETARYVKI